MEANPLKSILGVLFRHRFGKDPAKLSVKEIDSIVFADKKIRYRNSYGRNVVFKRGDVFPNRPLDGEIDDLFLQRISKRF